jgi:bifunctional DNA primase/polymerase-like protein
MSTAGVLDPMADPADHRVLAVLRHGAVLAAEAGYYVFPVQQGEKVPARSNWETRATRSRRRLETWWQTTPYNPLTGLAAD